MQARKQERKRWQQQVVGRGAPLKPGSTWYLLLSTLRVRLPRISLPPKHTATSCSGAMCGGCGQQQWQQWQ
jgi:hypothetical protein